MWLFGCVGYGLVVECGVVLVVVCVCFCVGGVCWVWLCLVLGGICVCDWYCVV